MINFRLDKNSNLLLKKNEKLEYYMDPYLFLIKGQKRFKNEDERKKAFLCFFQNSLHDILNFFLNPMALSRTSRVLYPFRMEYNSDINLLIKKIRFAASNLEIYFPEFDKLSTLLKKCNKQDSKIIAEIISEGYKLFSLSLGSIDIKLNEVKIVPKDIAIEKYKSKDSEYLKPVVQLHSFANGELESYLTGFFVHGSMADLKYIKGYSDVDTLLIVKQSVVDDSRKILKLRKKCFSSVKYLYSVDYYQHHCYSLITDYDLLFYPMSYFPLVLFDYSIFFLKTDRLIFRLRDSSIEQMNEFWNKCHRFRKIHIKNCDPKSMFDLKLTLGSILLMPSLYLQAINVPCYKRESFNKIKKDFEDYWDIVEQVSKLRKEWGKRIGHPKGFYQFILNINPELTRLLYVVTHMPIKSWIFNFVPKDYLKQCYLLTDAMLEKAKKHYEIRKI